MEEQRTISFNGKTVSEIADSCFNAEHLREMGYSVGEISALRVGFIEGFSYLFPFYENARRLCNLYEDKNKQKHAPQRQRE